MNRPETLRAPLPEVAVEQLKARFGRRYVTNADVLMQHGRSETHFPARPPEAVIMAHTTDEVVEVVKLCAAHRTPLTPFGAGTSLEGNATPIRGGVSLDLSEMNGILAVNPDDFDCTVQAGVTRTQLNEHLRDQGLFFPIDPGANATIGGMAATRASGTNAVRYGTMKAAVIGLSVVTPDGEVLRTGRRARKSAAGYDLTSLFVGSEGTLGVITEVTLRLQPIPESILAAVCPFASLHGAVQTVVQTVQSGVPIARVELLDDVQMRAVNSWSRLNYPEQNTLFFEFHGSSAFAQEQVETVAALASENGGGELRWATSNEERTKLWKARHDAYYAALGLRPGSIGWTTDVCVPISRLAECIEATRADLDAAQMLAPIVGHVGDGNFHVIFVLDPDAPDELETAAKLNEALVARALSMDGTCTGEHGVGLGKIRFLEWELGGAVGLMRTLKRAIDPDDIMNPGKIFEL